ncbi:uncharacterized protein LOC141631337 [Silene latifolia]|uniref:uncharacterized protein LOC141631337 n=1 Tax=Silene latifolia TaxID=37657 RepID=UPI003D77F414
MQKVMKYLVGEYQNAFIAGRSITDNILVAHEAIHKINMHKTGKRGMIAFKADMSKAFDRVKWDFLQAVLSKMGFPDSFISLVMSCVTTVSYEVLFNGSPLIEKAQWERKIKGLRICRGVTPLTHLLFADDSLFFMEDKGRTTTNLRRILKNYCTASGQVINDDKSGLIFSPNTKLRQVRLCLKVFRIKKNKGFGKYLGLPTDFQESKKDIFKGLVENVLQRISSWNGLLLLLAGRLTLIMSILSNLSIFFLSVFKIPPGIDSNLNAWSARWVDGGMPEPVDLLLEEGFGFMKDLCIKDLCFNGGGWNEGMVRLIFKQESVDKILATPLISTRIHDEVFWPFSNDGRYTVKRPQLWKILLWKIITGSLPVGSEFIKRNLGWDPFCTLCGKGLREVETLEHLFRDCDVSSRIWFGSVLGIRTNQNNYLDLGEWIINWITYLKGQKENCYGLIHFLATLNSIWLLRNNSIFRGENLVQKFFFKQLGTLVSLVIKTLEMKNTNDGDGDGDGVSITNEPEELENESNCLKNGLPHFIISPFGSSNRWRIMVDASWDETGIAAFGWAVLGAEGKPLFKGMLKGRAESPLQAEAIGVLKVLEWAKSQGFFHLEVSLDCLSMLQQ